MNKGAFDSGRNPRRTGTSNHFMDMDGENPVDSVPMEVIFEISPRTLKKVPLSHEFLYILLYDLAALDREQGKTPVVLVKELMMVGIIVDAEIIPPTLEMEKYRGDDPLWYAVLYSTILEPEFLKDAVGVDETGCFTIDRDNLPEVDGIRFDIAHRKIHFITLEALSKTTESGMPANALPPTPKPKPETAPVVSPYTAERQEISVELTKLDYLIDLMGELVIAESMVTQHPDLKERISGSVERATHNLRRIISELQDTVMSFRTVPLQSTFRQMDRLVREMAAKSGKSTELKVIGEETEVDKTVVDQLTGPLIRLLRYSIMNGIESATERSSSGKPAVGNLILEGRQEGGEILIRVSDDGRGLDRNELVRRAAGMGIDVKDSGHLSDQEVFRFILMPGFTAFDPGAGPGLELDMVQRSIEDLKGRIDIESLPGVGTSISLRIPMTLIIMDGMLIRIGESAFIIPMIAIRESFRPNRKQVTTTLAGHELVMWRGSLIPVIRLDRHYHIRSDCEELEQGVLISVASGSQAACLFADEIIGMHQAVIKKWPPYIGETPGLSGCTVLENGSVCLVLDIGGVLDMLEES